MGLDPPGKVLLSKLLDRVSTKTEHSRATPVVLGLRPQDAVPKWSTHVAYVEGDEVVTMGEKASVIEEVRSKLGKVLFLEGDTPAALEDMGVVEKAWAGVSGLKPAAEPTTASLAEPLVEMDKIKVAYYDKVIFENFTWTIRRGERWGLFGPNGTVPLLHRRRGICSTTAQAPEKRP